MKTKSIENASRTFSVARTSVLVLIPLLFFGCFTQPAMAAGDVALPAGAGKPAAVDISAGTLAEALNQLAKQTGANLVYRPDQVAGLKTPGVKGDLTTAEAINKLLEGTGLRLTTNAAGAFLIASPKTSENRDPADQMRVAMTGNAKDGASSGSEDKDSKVDDGKGIPEILVKERRSLNTDIQRTEDDPQPYVVFDKEEIRRAQAVNLQEFLQTRLPMNNHQRFNPGQTTGSSLAISEISLRGLGSNQTLILVDGRRMPEGALSGSPYQPDLNGIPLAAIERIEVLPSTAGGIYGGSATGGVINVILRRDFRGLEVSATYGNTFDTDAANMRLDATSSFSLEGGRTQVMVTATRSEANNLTIGDRDFAARAIALQEKNNPADIAAMTFPPLGATVNIRGVGGALLSLKPQYGGTALISGITNQPTNFTHLPLGYAGPVSDSGAALLMNAGRYNLNLPDGVNGLERGLVAAPSMESVALNLRREFRTWLEAFVDLSRLGNRGSSFTANVPEFVNLPADAPNNPFQQAISVRFPTPGLSFEQRFESTTVRAIGGLIIRLPYNWMGEASYGWSRSRFQTIQTFNALDAVGNCVLSRGVAANIDPDGAGSLEPCNRMAPNNTNDVRPALNILQEGNTFPIDFTPYLMPSPNSFNGPNDTILRNATTRFSGPVFNVAGGPVTFSVLVERNEQEMEDAIIQDISTTTRAPTYIFRPRRSQDISSYYLEARVPLISSSNALPLARKLELQASVRHDKYKTRSVPGATNFSVPSRDGPFPSLTYTTNRLDSADYTLALRYAPLEDLALRASVGTGFLPPGVNFVAPSQGLGTFSLGTDPKRGNTDMYVGVPFIRYFNGNPDLKPEQSRNLSAGLILTPRFVPGLRLSIDYTRIEKTDEIQSPDPQFLLDHEDDFPGRIIRGANLNGDLPGWAGPIIQFDTTYINLAKTWVAAWDIQASYNLETERFGGFHWYALTTWQTRYRNQTLALSPVVVDRVGFNFAPLEWRGNLGLNWTKGPLALGWNAQYYDSYWIYGALPLPLTPAQRAARETSAKNQGSATIPAQIYHDVIATYRFDSATSIAGRLLANGEISFGVQNLFDKSPPILASTNPLAMVYSHHGDPRMRRYTVSLVKRF